MTHAESQDLLLDLAYGELDAARAAEVEAHVSSCPECRKEKEAIDEARRIAAPIREVEEPSPGFDDRILQAARAQAQLEHDGNVGEVIEVTGTVRPLGVEAARIDAHGPVKARPAERRRPRWVMRTAVAGSVAAAAALALVVGNTLEERRNAEKAAAARTTDFEIRVQPAPTPQVVDSALRDAQQLQREKDEPAGAAAGGVVASPPSEEKKAETAAQLPLRKRAASRAQGSGGDAAEAKGKAKKSAQPTAAPEPQHREVAAGGRRLDEEIAKVAEVPEPKSARSAAPGAPVAAAPPAPAVREEAPAASVAAPIAGAAHRNMAVTPGTPALEASAQQARHAGNYALAASLYRDAAAAREREGDASTAAWDLAHAVECLSAAGQFEEAKKTRDELARAYPGETAALSAAQRALREVDVPARPPAAPPR